MTVRFNDTLALWAVGVLQPATAEDVRLLILAMYPEASTFVAPEIVTAALRALEHSNCILRVQTTAGFYSATRTGNARFTKALRVTRDSARLFLMRTQRADRVRPSGESIEVGSGGVSPSDIERPGAKGAARTISSPGEFRATTLPGRTYRPRVIQQLVLPAGTKIDSPDVHLRYGSFATLSQIHTAAGGDRSDADVPLDELALCIGITPALLRSMLLRKHRFYRSFELPKRGGGKRRIDAPRVFMKSVQQWVDFYLLQPWLKVHDACYSYRVGRSIISNAQAHLGKAYVGGLDIEDFFGSITKSNVERHLRAMRFGPELAHAMSGICTLDGCLPQGAPTSPTLSNSYLHDFDEYVAV